METETRENILKMARQEFLLKGYQGAWLRDIARQAGVTTGALYGYFKNKEELFGALVEEEYQEIQNMYREILEQFSHLPVQEQYSDMETYTIRSAMRMVNYMYAHYEAFKLLLCCAGDTEYDDLVERMARLDEQATGKFTETVSAAGMPIHRMTYRLEHILTTGLFTMFFELIVHDVPREEAEEYVTLLIRFYAGGYGRLMGF